MNSMNICLVYPGYYPDDFAGGIGTILDEYLKMFKGKKEKIILISRTLESKKTTYVEDNIEIHRIPTDVNKFVKILNVITKNKFRMLFYSISLYFYLKKISKDKKMDIIEGCDWGAELYFTLKHNHNIPTIIRVHTPSFISEKYNPGNKSYLGNYTKRMERKLLNDENVIIVTPDNSIIKEFKQENVIPKHIIYDVCYPLPDMNREKEEKTNYNIMFAGRLEERKGIETIFYLMKTLLVERKLLDIKFNFYGADTILKNNITYREMLLKKYELEKFVESNINFYGYLPRKVLLEHMRRMDMYISASNYELVGYSALEAVKSGNILVHSGTGFLRKFIRDNKEGFVFKNREELVEKVLKIINNDINNLEQVKVKGIDKVCKYTNREYLYTKTIKLYKSVLRNQEEINR